jgi:TatD DNase family protein
MKLFDSHCHIDSQYFEKDIEQVIGRMKSAGVAGAMIVGVDRSNTGKAVAMARNEVLFYASVGVHPHDVKHCSESTIQDLVDLTQEPKVRAWGETGLDFNRMHSPKADQEHWFIRQLEAADETSLPVILHERDSEGRLLDILQAHSPSSRQGVVHCFSGTTQEMFHYLDIGLHIGITGIVTVKGRGEKLRGQVPHIPIDRILIETDAPYLTPVPERNRHKRNEPAFVKSVLLKLAEVLGKDPEELSEIIWDNTCRLYGISNMKTE